LRIYIRKDEIWLVALSVAVNIGNARKSGARSGLVRVEPGNAVPVDVNPQWPNRRDQAIHAQVKLVVLNQARVDVLLGDFQGGGAGKQLPGFGKSNTLRKGTAVRFDNEGAGAERARVLERGPVGREIEGRWIEFIQRREELRDLFDQIRERNFVTEYVHVWNAIHNLPGAESGEITRTMEGIVSDSKGESLARSRTHRGGLDRFVHGLEADEHRVDADAET
jgi:hypothetical protein